MKFQKEKKNSNQKLGWAKENVSLSRYSSFCIGGPARFFCSPQSEEELKEVVEQAQSRDLSVFILGGGTNLLISDLGFNGLVIHPNIQFLKRNEIQVRVGAGVLVRDFINFTIENSLSGLEWAGGLPGMVGGAIRGNAGAFMGETKDSIESVRSLNVELLQVKEWSKEECDFGYRSSAFKKAMGKEIIISGLFSFVAGDDDKIRASVNEKIQFRASRHPIETPNIGSIFKNVSVERFIEDNAIDKEEVASRFPVKQDPFAVIPAAYLISEAGLKGVRCGGALVSEKHPNFIVNAGNASSDDVEILIKKIKTEVQKKFSVLLEEEIQRVS